MTDRPTGNDLTFGKISNGHISARGQPMHFMFGSIGWVFRGRRIEWRYFRFDQIQDGGLGGIFRKLITTRTTFNFNALRVYLRSFNDTIENKEKV